LGVHARAAGAAPGAGVVVGVVEPPAAGTVVVVVAAAAAAEEPATVVVVGSDAAVVDGSEVDWPTVVSVVPVVPVVPVLWALTACIGTTVRAAMAPPVVTAEPRAATSALFLMVHRLGRPRHTALGVSSDGAPNS
jgi:hypothetical protein